MDFGIPHYQGCQRYTDMINNATDRLKKTGETKGFYIASVHRENCDDCKSMNSLEKQLFGESVEVMS